MTNRTPRPDAGPMPPASPAFLMAALGRHIRDDVEESLRPTGFTLRHLSALGHLHREPGISYSELARRAGVTAQSAQATVRQLEQRGAVERRSLPGRGHTAELHITDKGHDLLEAGKRAYAAADEALSLALDSEQLTALTGLLLTALSSRRPGS
ncbi:MarR family winged helix-turn-helix transcriptional regulator [Streptomyces sp. DH10]|uniref:MarR family winged helix-turn-helix transcriptional regulator n=1 Tax=Streptomyces sp. DH10 TaxID=3040121 RepID=UPI0024435DC8|nr:MarR family transcriptional regulator [Streptomyces sp. DH10]MDG9708023.1 MarR family transcriptional regulator [Streptomyces sp. DH10]